jgi:hypothetical protein
MEAFTLERNILARSIPVAKIDLSEHLGHEGAACFVHVNKHKIPGDNHIIPFVVG